MQYIAEEGDKVNGSNLEKKFGGAVIRDKAAITECAVRFALALAVSWARVFGDISPFAAAFTASAGAGAPCIFSLLGAAIGYLTGPSLTTGLKYIAISLLTAAAGNIFRELETAGKKWFMPAVSAAICLAVSAAFTIQAKQGVSGAVKLVVECAICGMCAYFYRLALSPWDGKLNFEYAAQSGHTAGVLMLAGTLMLTLSNIRLLGTVSAGNIAACFCVMMFAYKAGAGTGCAVGAAVGIIMDAGRGAGIFCTSAYCIAVLAAGILSRRMRIVSAVGFVIANGAVTAM
ncbi:MAG: hypothetical protein IJ072_02325, partial [Oscillospiraceae bacterium]|nr:hypothetical protein [Oscillospiraceae bacterium]